jgi:hypothetical protein
MKQRLVTLMVHVLFVVCFGGLSYSAKNYYFADRFVVPVARMLDTQPDQKVADVILRQLPHTDNGDAARSLVSGQVQQLQTYHDAWLTQAERNALFARNQTLFWAIAFVAAIVAMLANHRGRRDAA